jgi:26S proteasome regulatory subunit (ATPase 3-interacting protein)
VPKTAVQKILLALAEKGELVQKTYGISPSVLFRLLGNLSILFGIGKTSFFVANQANIEAIPAERFAALEEEYKAIEEENKLLGAEVKTLSSGLVLIPYNNRARTLTIDIRTCETENYPDGRRSRCPDYRINRRGSSLYSTIFQPLIYNYTRGR